MSVSIWPSSSGRQELSVVASQCIAADVVTHSLSLISASRLLVVVDSAVCEGEWLITLCALSRSKAAELVLQILCDR